MLLPSLSLCVCVCDVLEGQGHLIRHSLRFMKADYGKKKSSTDLRSAVAQPRHSTENIRKPRRPCIKGRVRREGGKSTAHLSYTLARPRPYPEWNKPRPLDVFSCVAKFLACLESGGLAASCGFPKRTQGFWLLVRYPGLTSVDAQAASRKPQAGQEPCAFWFATSAMMRPRHLVKTC